MPSPLHDAALDQLFSEARTVKYWLDQPVSDATLHRLTELVLQGPTAANSLPARLVFVRSAEGKARLRPCLAPGNVEQTMAAPVTVIVAYDLDFPDTLPAQFPHVDARSWYVGNDALIRETAFRNGSLQGAYVILAARALGLDAGPMSGFDAAAVDAEFFSGERVHSNFLINLGHGDRSRLHARAPRPPVEQIARWL